MVTLESTSRESKALNHVESETKFFDILGFSSEDETEVSAVADVIIFILKC